MAVTSRVVPGGPPEFYCDVGDTKPTVASHAENQEPKPGSILIEYTAADDSGTIIYFTPDGTNWYTLIESY